MPTLLLPARYTDDSVALWRTALALGWNVERLSTPRVDPSWNDPVLYLDGLLGGLVADQLGLAMVGPPLDWLCHLPWDYRRREVRFLTWKEARELEAPAFFKPADDKWFPARVYQRGRDIDVPEEFDDTAPVLVIDPVRFEVEYRFFVLDRQVLTGSLYSRQGERDLDGEVDPAALASAQRLLADPRVSVPRALVIDIGLTTEHGWVAVEANPAWAAGLYNCDPEQALRVIAACAKFPGPSPG